MKEFKEDKRKLEEEIKELITSFNAKYDVKISDIDLEYIKFPGVVYDSEYGYLKVTTDIDI